MLSHLHYFSDISRSFNCSRQ